MRSVQHSRRSQVFGLRVMEYLTKIINFNRKSKIDSDFL